MQPHAERQSTIPQVEAILPYFCLFGNGTASAILGGERKTRLERGWGDERMAQGRMFGWSHRTAHAASGGLARGGQRAVDFVDL